MAVLWAMPMTIIYAVKCTVFLKQDILVLCQNHYAIHFKPKIGGHS